MGTQVRIAADTTACACYQLVPARDDAPLHARCNELMDNGSDEGRLLGAMCGRVKQADPVVEVMMLGWCYADDNPKQIISKNVWPFA